MIVKLLTEHYLEFLSLTGGCRGSSESTLVKMSNCWKSHAAAQVFPLFIDMDALDKKLTSVFRTSLPGDEALARILSPSILASEVTGNTGLDKQKFSA